MLLTSLCLVTAPVDPRHRGASLIEVLVAILILSFGVLAMAGMVGYSVQQPRLAANRALASNIAHDLIARIQANPAGSYATSLTYDGQSTVPPLGSECVFPDCTPALLATMDVDAAKRNARALLPSGGLQIDISAGLGKVYVVWKEAESAATFATVGSDLCPPLSTAVQSPQPRCLMVPFAP